MREEGPAALYKGFTPKVLRLAPGGGVLLLVVEFTLGTFRKRTSCLLHPLLTSTLTFSLCFQSSAHRTSRHILLSPETEHTMYHDLDVRVCGRCGMDGVL